MLVRARLLPAVMALGVLLLACGGGQPGGTPAAGPSPTPSAAACAPAEPGWQRLGTPTAFGTIDGYAGSDGCRLVLVGQQGSPRVGTPVPKEEGTPAQGPPLFQPAVVLLSDDGGKTFRVAARFPEARGQSPDVNFRLTSVAFSDALTGWAAGAWLASPAFGPLLVKSTDGGESWAEASVPPEVQVLTAVAASEEATWLAGRDKDCTAFLLTSTDGGATWQEPVRMPRASQRCAYLSDVAVAGTTVMAVGTDGLQGLVMVSHDSGQTFERSSSASGLIAGAEAVAMLDSQHAYVAAWSLPSLDAPIDSRTAALLRSDDGGNTWQKVSFPNLPPEPLYPEPVFLPDLLFLSPERGYVAAARSPGENGMLVTADGGLTWEFQPLDFLGYRLFAAGDGTIYAAAGGPLYRAKP